MAEIMKKSNGEPLTRDFIGTNAERLVLDTNNLPVGSTFMTTDTDAIYVWVGAAWAEV